MNSSNAKSDYEAQREKNILEMRKILGYNFNPDALGLQPNIHFEKPPTPKKRVVRRKKENDRSFHVRDVHIPEERRQSLRIAKMEPLLSYDFGNDDNYHDDIRHFVQKRRPSRTTSEPNTTVDGYRSKEVTQNDIDNIAKSCRDKKKSGVGTTCHQCRQCSADTKTFCHNAKCTGINGQLCGPCLHGRYGEDLETTLKDPQWICPYCRGICNCSLCRRRSGQVPTGILSHIATKQGYKSVHHFLNNYDTDLPESTSGYESDTTDTLSVTDNNEDSESDIVVKEIEIYQYFDVPGDMVKNFNKADFDVASMFKIQNNAEFGVPVSNDNNEVLYKFHVGGETKFIKVQKDFPQGAQGNLKDLEESDNSVLKSMDRVEDTSRALYTTSKNFVRTGEECLLGFDRDLKPVTTTFA